MLQTTSPHGTRGGESPLPPSLRRWFSWPLWPSFVLMVLVMSGSSFVFKFDWMGSSVGGEDEWQIWFPNPVFFFCSPFLQDIFVSIKAEDFRGMLEGGGVVGLIERLRVVGFCAGNEQFDALSGVRRKMVA